VGGNPPVVLAVHAGALPGSAKQKTVKGSHPAILVPDPRLEISQAYGVHTWPTAVLVDIGGRIREIRQGLLSEQDIRLSAESGTKNERPGKDRKR
jgi:hypothetical protein